MRRTTLRKADEPGDNDTRGADCCCSGCVRPGRARGHAGAQRCRPTRAVNRAGQCTRTSSKHRWQIDFSEVKQPHNMPSTALWSELPLTVYFHLPCAVPKQSCAGLCSSPGQLGSLAHPSRRNNKPQWQKGERSRIVLQIRPCAGSSTLRKNFFAERVVRHWQGLPRRCPRNDCMWHSVLWAGGQGGDRAQLGLSELGGVSTLNDSVVSAPGSLMLL